MKSFYTLEYFDKRLLNDKKRIASFLQEENFIKKFIDNGVIMDVGCSTGEFLESITWVGEKYGMEVSEFAIKEAKEKGIKFDKTIFNSENYFDLIIFRGTIQHIDEPFRYIKAARNALKKGGYLFFICTPNANSICYKIFNTLPFLQPEINYYIPSETTLINACENFNFTLLKIEKPYWDSPYRSFVKDMIVFLLRIIKVIKNPRYRFSFPGNMMNIVFYNGEKK